MVVAIIIVFGERNRDRVCEGCREHQLECSRLRATDL